MSAHTLLDLAALQAEGIDPDSTAPRERAVRCVACSADTFNIQGWCDAHHKVPGAVLRKRAAEARRSWDESEPILKPAS